MSITVAKKVKVGATDCTLTELLFPVELREETMRRNTEYCMKVVGQVDGEDYLLNQCSDRYELIPNNDIFPKVEEVLNNNGIQFKVTYSHINFVRFYADYQITDSRYAYNMVGTTDTIQPMLRVRHSYNGLTKYTINFGYFRLICTNGLTIPVEEMKEFNLCITGKHTISIQHSLVRLNEMLIYFSENAMQITSKITAKFEQLGGQWIADPAKRLEEVLASAKITAVENTKFNTINDILNRISLESNNPTLGYEGKVNDWLIWNGINQYINDDNRNIMVPEKRMEIDSNVLEFMLA